MPENNWESDKMLDVYIHDYLRKRNLHATAEAFLAESNVSSDAVAIQSSSGFLLEWWSVFWDIFVTRMYPNHSEAASSYIQTLNNKAQEQQQQENMQLLLLRKAFQQQQQYEEQQPKDTYNPLGTSSSVGPSDSRMKQSVGDNTGHQMDPIQAFAYGGQSANYRQMFHGISRNLQQPLVRSQPFQMSSQGIANDINSIMSPRTAVTEGKLALNGWPLDGSDNLRSQLLQQQKSLTLTPQSFNQIQLEKLLLQSQQNQVSNYPGNSLFDPPTPSLSHLLLGQDKKPGRSNMIEEGSMSNTTAQTQTGRKRKQRQSSLGPCTSSGTAKTTGVFSSTDMAGDIRSMPPPAACSKSTFVHGCDSIASRIQPVNKLANTDHIVDNGYLDDNAESYNSRDVADSKGFTLKEIQHVKASTSEVECCHFSPDGKLLATGGQDKKAVVWCSESLTEKFSLEEHVEAITDVRFGPKMLRMATSSADTTVKIWDLSNPSCSFRTFTGHLTGVMSLDFHPRKLDLICSCDNLHEIRTWSIKNASCVGVLKGGATYLRFQPRGGRFLAAAADKIVSIIDVDTQVCSLKLQGHKSSIHSVSWDSTGQYLASVSDESVRVWSMGHGTVGDCIHELSTATANLSFNKFRTCVFHPTYASLLVIACHQGLELWNMKENKMMTLATHDGLISALAVSTVNKKVASASHDSFVKLWN